MKLSCGVVGALILAGSSGAQTVWTGPDINFTKPNGADWTLPENQDRITDSVWITRKNAQGIYNIAVEAGYGAGSPADTEWAYGDAADYENLKFASWVSWAGGFPPGTVGQDAVLHLISEDIYIDIRFSSWSCCGAGGFSYDRSTRGECLTVTDESIDCHADGSTFTYTVQGTDSCTGGSSSYVFTASGGAPGEQMCFTVLVTGNGGFCCTTDLCVTVPVCPNFFDCPWDLDQSATVEITDFLLLLDAWGTSPGGPPDFDLDGSVGITDLLEQLANWGPCSFFVDCNDNGLFDYNEVNDGTVHDCNNNGVPDECEQDCNDNGLHDQCDIADGTSTDCNGNGIPDSCDITDDSSLDCNENGLLDQCDIADGTSTDCNENGIPDACDVADGTSQDCNDNGLSDACDIANGTSPDCNGNGIPDPCDLAAGTSQDFNANGVPDECETGVPPNDNCFFAAVITDGATPFSTLGATTDGIQVDCEGGGGSTAFVKDIWFRYTASCTGIATFSLCGAANFDTRLAVDLLEHCPPVAQLACNDDAAGCGQTSEIQLFVFGGFDYLIRVGGTDGGGLGVLTISCQP